MAESPTGEVCNGDILKRQEHDFQKFQLVLSSMEDLASRNSGGQSKIFWFTCLTLLSILHTTHCCAIKEQGSILECDAFNQSTNCEQTEIFCLSTYSSVEECLGCYLYTD